MRVSIRRKNLEITSPLQVYIQSKLEKPLERILKTMHGSDLPMLQIEVERSTKHHRKGTVYRAEATLSLEKKVFFAEVSSEDIRSAIDLLGEEMEREIQGFKSRKMALLKRGARRAKKDMRFDPAARMYRKGRIREEGM